MVNIVFHSRAGLPLEIVLTVTLIRINRSKSAKLLPVILLIAFKKVSKNIEIETGKNLPVVPFVTGINVIYVRNTQNVVGEKSYTRKI